MARLGHRTPTVAMRYQHATAERDQAIASRLGPLMRVAVTEEQPLQKIIARVGDA